MMDYDGLWMIIPNIVKLKKDIEVTNSEEFTTLHGFVVDSIHTYTNLVISAQKIQRSCLSFSGPENLYENERSVHDKYFLKPKGAIVAQGQRKLPQDCNTRTEAPKYQDN